MSSDDDLTVLISATTAGVQVAAFIGEEAELPCKTTDRRGSIKWFVGKVDSETADDDTQILFTLLDATTQPAIRLSNFRYDLDTRSLYIRNVSVDQDGYFTCIAQVFMTTASVRYQHVRLTVYGEIQLSAQVSPCRITRSSVGMTAKDACSCGFMGSGGAGRSGGNPTSAFLLLVSFTIPRDLFFFEDTKPPHEFLDFF